MKYVKKVFGILASFLLMGTFALTSCSDSDDGGDDETPSSTITEVTVNFGEEKEIYIPGKTACEFDRPAHTGLTVEPVDGKPGYFKIVAADADSTYEGTVTAYFVDENGVNDQNAVGVTIYVYNPLVKMPITLDEGIADVSKITVHYEGKTKEEDAAGKDAAHQETVDAVKDDNGNWYVLLKKEIADANWKWFNNIVVTVYSEGNEVIPTDCSVISFCYTVTNSEEEGYCDELPVTSAVLSKTFTIHFKGFTIESVKGLKYSNTCNNWDNENVTTPNVTVANDGASATFDVTVDSLTSKKEFYINWGSVKFIDSSNNEVTGLNGIPEDGKWYSYTRDVWSVTLTRVTGDYEAVVNSSSFNFTPNCSIATSTDFSGYESISAIRITLTLSNNAQKSDDYDFWFTPVIGNNWYGDCKLSLSENSTYTVTVTDATTINAFTTNEICIGSNVTDSAATVLVEVIGTKSTSTGDGNGSGSGDGTTTA